MNNLKNIYEMQKLEQENSGEETRSPYINELIKLIKRIKEEEATQEELVEQVNSLINMFENLKQVADYLKASQPPSDDFEVKYARLQELLSLCNDSLSELGLYYDDGNEEHLDVPMEKLKAYIAEIFEITDSLKEVEQNQKVYVGSLEVNEALRIGYGFCDGIYSLDTFVEKLENLDEAMGDSYDQMLQVSEEPMDTKALEKNMPEILKTLKDMVDSIGKLFDLTSAEEEGKNKEEIRKNLEVIEKGAERITEIQKEITDEIAKIEEERKMRTCPRCGAKTSAYEPNCQQCKMMLPPLPDGYLPEEPSLDIVASEGGVSGQGPAGAANGQKMVTPNVAKIYKVALGVAQGQLPPEELGKMIEWYGGLTDKAREEFERIAEPENLTEEEKQVFNEAHNLFKEGVYGAIDGLNELQEFFADKDLSHISNGMNMLIDSGEKMYTLETMGDIINKKMAAGGGPINPDGTPATGEATEEIPAEDPGLA